MSDAMCFYLYFLRKIVPKHLYLAYACNDDEVLPFLQLVYKELLEKLRDKEEKEAKRRQRLADNFSNLLWSAKVC